MVCSKCQKVLKATELATPNVKRKSEMYYGSTSTSTSTSTSNSTSTSKPNGISKSKLLSKSAKNPYAAYSSSCATCKTKTDQGRKFCHRCAYKANGTFHAVLGLLASHLSWEGGTDSGCLRVACAMCGKSQGEKKNAPGVAPVVQGQRFSAK
ncbi:MAG: hypothetical protein M1816_000524 [Peltula sp. TS41687]|nr:MAG: hypothetical protein M1816_000524 [Peltula sp. TS41687]